VDNARMANSRNKNGRSGGSVVLGGRTSKTRNNCQ
jgi:hypothetical protein